MFQQFSNTVETHFLAKITFSDHIIFDHQSSQRICKRVAQMIWIFDVRVVGLALKGQPVPKHARSVGAWETHAFHRG